MDWGLLRPQATNFLLRDELVFYRWVKYSIFYKFLKHFKYTCTHVTPHDINKLFVCIDLLCGRSDQRSS